MKLYFQVYNLEYRIVQKLIDRTQDPFPSEHGKVVTVNDAPFVIVDHKNYLAGKNTLIQDIYVVPKAFYAPVRQVKDTYRALIGYYRLPFHSKIYRVFRDSNKILDPEVRQIIEEKYNGSLL